MIRGGYDIFFLSNGEPGSEERFDILRVRFPRAVWVKGIDGLVAAHKRAASLSRTNWFWVVDADNVISPNFDFSFRWPYHFDDRHLGVWSAYNPVIDEAYGNGGIKLFPKRGILEIPDNVVDMTFSVDAKIHEFREVASITVIDDDPFIAWRSAFRESFKLKMQVDRKRGHYSERARYRLSKWLNSSNDAVRRGAEDAMRMYDSIRSVPEKINDYQWLRRMFDIGSRDVSSLDTLSNCIAGGYEILKYASKYERDKLSEAVYWNSGVNWADMFSFGQIRSKVWISEVLGKFPRGTHIGVMAGWIGQIVPMLAFMGAERFTLVDKDPRAMAVARHWLDPVRNVVFKECDINDITIGELVSSNYDVIINTSCEHIRPDDFSMWLKRVWENTESTLILQSNDMYGVSDHVNCHDTLDDFVSQVSGVVGDEVDWAGELDLGDFRRFMIILRKN